MVLGSSPVAVKGFPLIKIHKRGYTTLQLCDLHEVALQFTMCNWVTKLSWLDFSGLCSKAIPETCSTTINDYSSCQENQIWPTIQRRRRWNYNSGAWHNQQIWHQEHIYWWRTPDLQMIMMTELPSLYFEFTIF